MSEKPIRVVTEIVCEKLNRDIETIDVHESFFNMGIDSRQMLEIIDEIYKRYGELNLAVLTQCPDILSISNYLATHFCEPSDSNLQKAKPLSEENTDKSEDQTKYLLQLLAKKLECEPESIDIEASFFSLGVESILAQEIVAELGKKFSGLKATLLFEYPNIRDLNQFLTKKQSPKSKPESVESSSIVKEKTTQELSGSPPSLIKIDKIKKFLSNLFAQTLAVDSDSFDMSEPFFNMKLDPSKQAEIIQQLQKIFGHFDVNPFVEYYGIDHFSEYLESLPYSEKDLFIPDQVPTQEEIPVHKEFPVQEPVLFEKKDRNGKGVNIAVIGMGGRFPKAPTLDKFWNNLLDGMDCIEEIPKSRWDYDLFYDEEGRAKNKIPAKWGGFIEDVDKFDPLFFKISPREAEMMDPQQRLFLEVAWETLEDAGYAVREKLKKERVSVFVGAIWNEYSQYSNEQGLLKNSYGGPGSLDWMIPNRVSYAFNFTGPSIAVDTACSASLTAIHMACQSILTGECSISLAGGVNLSLHPSKYLFLGQAKFLAKDGRCRSFGSGGSGYVPGEGVAAILLKQADMAEKDGDRIYGIIRGTSVNHDGGATGFTVPNPGAQQELILNALKNAQVHPEEIGYVECHGTGTELGDPVELKGLCNVFQQYTDKRQFCPIGSLKANIGHLEGAAGIAGVIKTLLCLSKKMIPKSIHSSVLNPNLDFEDTPFHVIQENCQWEVPEGKSRIAAVSSFGAGGSNAHAILEEYQVKENRVIADLSPKMEAILLSAHSSDRLKEYVENVFEFLKGKKDKIALSDLAYTLQCGRESFDYRLLVLVSSMDDLLVRLRRFLENSESGDGFFTGVVEQKKEDSALTSILLEELIDNEDVVRDLILQKNMSALGKYWLIDKKNRINWFQLYRDYKANLISLPHYPFAKDSYWIPNNGKPAGQPFFAPSHYMQTGTKALHPLLDANISTLEKYRFKKTLTDNQFYIREHVVGHQFILPGVAYLEMVREAGKLLCNVDHEVALKNVLWLRPIVINNSPVEIFVEIIPKGEKINYEVYSGGDDSTSVIHSKGEIVRDEWNSSTKRQQFSFDQETLKARCTDFIETNKIEINKLFTSMGLHYGESFQCIESVYCNQEEALGYISLPSNTDGVDFNFTLHPSLLDSALRVSMCIAMNSGKRETVPYVPFSLGNLEVYGPLPRQCTIYAKRTSTEAQREQGIEKYDIYICDTGKNRVLVKMMDFLTRPYIDKSLEQKNGTVAKSEFRTEPAIISAHSSTSNNLSSNVASPFHEVLSKLMNIVADLLKMKAEAIDVTKELTEYGADSVMKMEFQVELDLQFDRELPATLLFEYPTILSLAKYLSESDSVEGKDEFTVSTVNLNPDNHLENSLPEINECLSTTADTFKLNHNDKRLSAENSKTSTGNNDNQTQVLSELTRTISGLLKMSTPIDVYKNLTDYGMDSVMMMELRMDLEEQYGEDLPATLLFDYSTIDSLARFLSENFASKETLTEQKTEIETIEEQSYPLSYSQRGLWYITELNPECSSYHVPTAAVMNWKIDLQALTRALEKLIQQQPALRTIFKRENENIRQIVQNNVAANILHEDATNWTDEEIKERLEKETKTLFEPENKPLWRALLLSHTETKHTLIVTVHHIVYDGLSTLILVQELFRFYEAEITGFPKDVKPLSKNYFDFINWQQDFIQGKRGEKSLEFWKKELAGELTPLQLPYDKPRPTTQTYNGASSVFHCDETITKALNELAGKNKATLFNVLVAAYFIMLYRNSGQEDLLIGIPTLGRTTGGYEKTIGYFVNMVVLRANLANNPSYLELLKQITISTQLALAHQNYPFSLLVEKLKLSGDPAISPIFQTDFILQNFDSGLKDSLKEKGVDIYYPRQQEGQFDLTMEIFEEKTGMEINLKYNQDLFEENTILRLIGHFQMIIQDILRNPEQTVQEIPILQPKERQLTLVDWNRTQVEYPKELGLHQLFERRVEKTPDSVAAIFDDEKISYGELNRRANRLASYLQELGVQPDTMIGIFMDRSLELIIGLLGILKSGAAYIPMDPSFPAERLGYMLEDSEAPVIVTEQKLLKMLPEHNAEVVVVDQIADLLAEKSEENPESNQKPDNLAYVIFTSGSTGRPKGVQIHHQAVVNFINSMSKTPGFSANDTLLSVTTISFDISILEIFLPFSQGGTVIVASREEVLDGETLETLITRHNVTVMQATPATWRLLEEARWSGKKNLKVLCGGEPMPPDLAEILLAKTASLWNMYGPTETTIWSTVEKVKSDQKILIGRPIDNTDIFILNSKLEPTPVGVAGRLYIGGDGLSKGYLKRPDLTAEKFISSPFSDNPEDKIYDTGDLARYMSDGSLECLGRVDNQVKIRGFRIELGDMEAALSQYENIKVNAVVVKDIQGEKILVAYFVPHGKPPTTSDLTAFLKERLPQYMIPSLFIPIEEMPLTPNGKIDRKALPDPVSNVVESEEKSVLPQNELERTLVKIWKDVLQSDRVGIHDNFFDLGGHSLRMAKVHARLKREMEADVTLIQLLQYPTVYSLAEFLSKTKTDRENPSIKKQTMQQDSSPKPKIEVPDFKEEVNSYQEKNSDIAIIGMGGRFPKAKNPNELWAYICKGKEGTTTFTDEELEEAGVPREEYSDKNYVRTRGYLENIGWFDHKLFGFSPLEAKVIDPQQRLFLEVVWEALEDAGYDSFQAKFPIGIYAGSGMNNYLTRNILPDEELVKSIGKYMIMIGNDKDFLCSRASYKLNLEGPSMVIQTACSSSLGAIDTACHSLRQYSCEMAIAGGVSLLEHGKTGYLYQEGMILSPDGHCRTFDEKASGTFGANGAGVVVLKRMKEAVDDQDHIYAVIKGSAVNNDGSLKLGYTAPREDGQATVIRSAHGDANIDPESISYIEAHGTGTKLGDPVEVKALTQAFREKTTKKGFCRIGSLKSNMGHLDAAAGVAGVIKTALSLKYKQIPPSLHYQNPNPEIDFENSPFVVNDKLTNWDFVDYPRRAGVSAFGIGGTNAHVVLEEAPPIKIPRSKRPDTLLILSAKTETALRIMADNLACHLEKHDTAHPEDTAYTLQVGRREFEYRAALVTKDRESAITSLREGQLMKSVASERQPGIIFMFPGQGSQYVNMGRELYQLIPEFRKEVDYCFDYLKKAMDLDLKPIVFPDKGNESEAGRLLSQTQYTQPALFIIEHALAKTLIYFGVKPDCMIGHSVGEYVAACIAGVFTLEEGLELIVMRGKLIWDLPEGDMLSIPLPESEIAEYLNEDLSIATINTAQRCVVSGTSEKIKELDENLGKREIRTVILQTSHAFHSFMMDPILIKFEEKLSRIAMCEPNLKYISNVSGTWITPDEATNPEYWGQHMRRTVRFADGIKELSKIENTLFLEVGPGTVLTTLTNQNLKDKKEKVVLSSMKHVTSPDTDYNRLLTTIGRLWLAGKLINWKNFHEGETRGRIPLPTYPFERTFCWVNSQEKRVEENKFNENTDNEVVVELDDIVTKNLEAIWMELLGTENCSDQDDFFDLGGDSLLAVRVIEKVRKQFNIELPTHILMQYPTFSNLRDYIQSRLNTNTDEKFQFLVTLNEGDENRAPLFMVHPVGGALYFYRDYSRTFGEKQPLYGFQSKSYTEEREHQETIEKLAQQYLKELLNFRPSGPYYLGGASFGGVVALEMAQCLKKQGKEVECLILIDTPAPEKVPESINNSTTVILYLFQDLLPVSECDLIKMELEEQVAYIHDLARKVGREQVIPPHFNVSYICAFLSHQRALLDYKPLYYSGKTIFFKPLEKSVYHASDFHTVWETLIDKLSVHEISGNHITMNYAPNIEKIVAILKREL